MLACVLKKCRWLLELWALVVCAVDVGVGVGVGVVSGRVESQTKLMRRRHAEGGVGGRVVGEVVNS